MRPVVFVRVADMKYYQGITDQDSPVNGGSYVNDTGRAHACYNFEPLVQDGEDYEKCLGFFMMAGGNGSGQLHIERIPGCEALKHEDSIDGVTVIFVSKALTSKSMRVVGFYKDAVVYRYPHYMNFSGGYCQEYQFEARKENCVVLPYSERFSKSEWYVPASTSKYSDFGFGRSNVWFAGSKGASKKECGYVERMLASIDNYQGENWMDRGKR